MLVALRAKFRQHSAMRHQLFATHTAKLVEHTHKDRYWGMCASHRCRSWVLDCGRVMRDLTSHFVPLAFSFQVTAATDLGAMRWASC
mgnify:CR=1 FL=1